MSDVKNIPSYQEGLTQLSEQLSSMLPAEKLEVFNADALSMAASSDDILKLTAGRKAVDFNLPHADGTLIRLSEQLKHGPVVVVFYRGVWCPYCNLALQTYQQILPDIKAAGASLMAISPMKPDSSLAMMDTNKLDFFVLSDVGNQVARNYTRVIQNPKSSLHAMTELGFDFFSFYDDETGELPIPAVFVIGTDQQVVFAKTEGGDYRQRTEAEAILKVLSNTDSKVA